MLKWHEIEVHELSGWPDLQDRKGTRSSIVGHNRLDDEQTKDGMWRRILSSVAATLFSVNLIHSF